MTILATCVYNGFRYYGWNKQPHQITVQGCLETAIQNALHQQTVNITGASRTDRQVHAHDQRFVFRYKGPIALPKIIMLINSYLPEDIRVTTGRKVADDFRVRHTAHKIYDYRINDQTLDPFHFETEHYYPFHTFSKSDITKLQSIANVFIGQYDFSCFAKMPHHSSTAINPVRTIEDIKVFREVTGRLIFRFTGPSFIRHQIRIILGSIMACFENKITLPQLQAQLSHPSTSKKLNYILPGKGLHLVQIAYTNG